MTSNITKLPILTDRSRILSYKGCPRQRFLEYHCLGTGIRKAKLNIATNVGSCVHLGRSSLLEGKNIELAVEIALEEWSKSANSQELDLQNSEDQLFVFEEQRSLIEGMIRIWDIIQKDRLLGEYDVITYTNEKSEVVKAVEPEINWTLIEGDETKPIIEVMSRPDAIFRSKLTGNLVVDSFKTTSSNNTVVFDEDGEPVDKNKYDDQGISELIAVESLYNVKVEGIKMDFFYKGQRKKSAYINSDGSKEQRKLQQSFIVHPWAKDNGFNQDYAVKWEWLDENGSKRRLGKGWNRVDIWKLMTMKEWVEIVASDFYEDLEGLIMTPYPYMRQEEDIENWKDQNSYQEETIARHLEYLKAIEPSLCGPRESSSGKVYKRALNKYFPQNRNSCYQWGGFCPFAIHCWEGEKTTSSYFEKRVPHHQKELEIKG